MDQALSQNFRPVVYLKYNEGAHHEGRVDLEKYRIDKNENFGGHHIFDRRKHPTQSYCENDSKTNRSNIVSASLPSSFYVYSMFSERIPECKESLTVNDNKKHPITRTRSVSENGSHSEAVSGNVSELCPLFHKHQGSDKCSYESSPINDDPMESLRLLFSDISVSKSLNDPLKDQQDSVDSEAPVPVQEADLKKCDIGLDQNEERTLVDDPQSPTSITKNSNCSIRKTSKKRKKSFPRQTLQGGLGLMIPWNSESDESPTNEVTGRDSVKSNTENDKEEILATDSMQGCDELEIDKHEVKEEAKHSNKLNCELMHAIEKEMNEYQSFLAHNYPQYEDGPSKSNVKEDEFQSNREIQSKNDSILGYDEEHSNLKISLISSYNSDELLTDNKLIGSNNYSDESIDMNDTKLQNSKVDRDNHPLNKFSDFQPLALPLKSKPESVSSSSNEDEPPPLPSSSPPPLHSESREQTVIGSQSTFPQACPPIGRNEMIHVQEDRREESITELKRHIPERSSNRCCEEESCPPPLPPKNPNKNADLFGSMSKKYNFDDKDIPSDEKSRSSVPPALPPKSPRFLPQRNCFSTLLEPSSVFFPDNMVEEGRYPAITSKTNQSLFLEKMGQRNIVQSDPQPPPFFRSFSTADSRHEELEKKLSLCDEANSEPSTIGRTSGIRMSSTLNEAVNANVDKHNFARLSHLFPRNSLKSDARLQHFPVKLEDTHHRLSLISTSSSNCGGAPLLTYDNDAFTFASTSDVHEAINSSCFSCSDDSLSSPEVAEQNPSYGGYHRSLSQQSSGTRLSSKFSHEKHLMFQRGRSIRPKKISLDSSVSHLLEEESKASSPPPNLIQADEIDGSENVKTTKRSKYPLYKSSTLASLSSNIKCTFGKFSSSHRSKKHELQRNLSETHETKEKVSKQRSVPSLAVPPLLKKTTFKRDHLKPVQSNDVLSESIIPVLEERTEFSDVSEDSPTTGRRKNQKRNLSISSELRTQSISSRDSNDGSDGFSIVSFVSDQIQTSEEELPSIQSHADCLRNKIQTIDYLRKDMDQYTVVLQELLETYSIMSAKTPDGIRQHFDRAFEEIKSMIKLQEILNKTIANCNYDIMIVVEAFVDNDFTVYKKYTVLANTLQKELKNHSIYFQENFCDLASKIMIPSRRLNVFVQLLKSYLNVFCGDVQLKLQDAVNYLENLKDQANTEMTISIIQNCPIELRLAGLIKQAGVIHYEGNFYKKQPYHVIVFSDILLITENKYDFFIYKHHMRSGQLIEVSKSEPQSFTLKVTKSYKNDEQCHKMKLPTSKERDRWVRFLLSWMENNRSSYANSSSNPELLQYLPSKLERFWPLSLWQIAPRLKEAVNYVKNIGQSCDGTMTSIQKEQIIQCLLSEEKKYIEKLNILLDPEAMPPPPILGSILRKLRRFHNGTFLPKLLQAAEGDNCVRVFECFIGNLPNLPTLYREFIETRAGLTLTMIDGDSVRLYITPINQLAFYIEWLNCVSSQPKYHSSVRGEMTILLNCVEDARVSLLHYAIPKCQLDFYKAGDIIYKGFLECKSKTISLKIGFQYYIILFEKMLVVTRLNLPYYDFIQEIWLDQVTLGPQMDCKLSFKIQEMVYKREIIYEFKAETKVERNQWFSSISQLLNKQAELIRSKVCKR